MVNFYHQVGYSGLFILLLGLMAVFTAIRGVVLILLIKKQSGRRDSIINRIIEDAREFNEKTASDAEGRERASAEMVVSTLMQVQMSGVYSSMHFLKLCAAVGPLLGLLGTVLGMVDVFSTLSEKSMPDPSLLAGGIWEALLTTVMGLTLAIPAIIVHYYLLMSLRGVRNGIHLRLCHIDPEHLRERG